MLSIALFFLLVSRVIGIVVDFWITVWTEDKLEWDAANYICRYNILFQTENDQHLIYLGSVELISNSPTPQYIDVLGNFVVVDIF